MPMLDPSMLDPRLMGMLNSFQPQQPMPSQPIAPQAAPAQAPGIFGSLSNRISNNPMTLMALGAGIMQGGFGKGLQGAMTGAQLDQKTKTANDTERYLVSKGLAPEVARTVAGNPALLQHVLKDSLGGAGDTSDIKEYQFAKSQGFDGSFEQWIQRKRAGAGEYGLSPVWGRDAEGNPVMMQAGKSGEAIRSKIPEGVTLSAKEPIKMDAGTHFVLMDPLTRQVIGMVPKDIAGAKSQEKVGEGRGEAIASLESLRSKMPGLESVVGKLDALSEKATYTLGGQAVDWATRQVGAEPREAAVARAEYISMVDNQVLPLLRDTFGAQFTQREGETLRATLGDPDKSPKEKQAVLKSFIEQKRRDVEAFASRVGASPPTAPAAAGAARSNPSDLKAKYGLE